MSTLLAQQVPQPAVSHGRTLPAEASRSAEGRRPVEARRPSGHASDHRHDHDHPHGRGHVHDAASHGAGSRPPRHGATGATAIVAIRPSLLRFGLGARLAVAGVISLGIVIVTSAVLG